MLGVVATDLLGGRGTVWMLGTDVVFDHARDLMRYGPRILDRWMQTFSRLENIIVIDNWKAIRLLERWGFTIGETVSLHGAVPHREAFVSFHLDRAAIQAPRLAA